MTWTAPEVADERPDLDMTADELPGLLEWLEMYRATVPLKVAGLTGEELCRQPVPGSTLSLLGVVRHLTEVERYWLTDVLLDDNSPDIYSHREAPEGDFELGTPQSAPADLERFEDEVAQARRHLAGVGSVDELAKGLRHGKPVNVRWILVHLIEEYARHLGHMDMLRGAVDGRLGY